MKIKGAWELTICLADWSWNCRKEGLGYGNVVIPWGRPMLVDYKRSKLPWERNIMLGNFGSNMEHIWKWNENVELKICS
jgi:hypothetical protein